jgi:hypothetical protein
MLECSELRIEEAANSPDRHARLAAYRVLESPKTWHDWGVSHNQLISQIATQRNAAQQSLAVKRMALSMIHLKAPFEYLREYAVRGVERQRFFQTLFGSHDYARAVVQEHRHYLSAMCSYLCVDRFCGSGSLHHIRDYERRYATYWNLQVQALEREARGDSLMVEVDADLLRSLRTDVKQAREQLLDAGLSAADRYTLEELRRPTGDTVRLRRPRFAPDYQDYQRWKSDK